MTKANIETTEVEKTETAISKDLLKEVMPVVLGIKKDTLKFHISDQEKLSDALDLIFGQRLTNVNDNLTIGFCNNKFYNSLIQLRHNGRVYSIYSNVSENKLRLNLNK